MTKTAGVSRCCWRTRVVHMCEILALCCMFCSHARSESNLCTDIDEDRIVDEVLNGSKYNNKISPSSFLGRTVNVELSIYMVDMTRVDDSFMEISAVILFRQTWEDPRLRHDHLGNCSVAVLHRNLHHRIWTPDLYFANERKMELHEHTTTNRLVWLYNDGRVFVSTRYTVTTSCPMKLQRFPFDTQFCRLHIESYGLTTRQLNLTLRPGKEFLLPKQLSLPKFHLVGFTHKRCNYMYEDTGDQQCSSGCTPCVEVELQLKREYGFHILAVYIPTAFIVIVSWVSFWVSHESIPGRVSLGVTTLLTITTQGVVSTLAQPQVPYVKAVDIWLSACCVFVFGVLFEYALVNALQRKKPTEMPKRVDPHRPSDQTSSDDYKQEVRANKKSYFTPGSVDRFSRVAFPCAFITFSALYWVYAVFVVSD